MAQVSKLSKARAALIIDQPFFASIICQLPMIEDPALNPPTMATNGKWIKFHPEFVEACSHDELVFTLCHEVGHVIFQHMFRRGTRDPKKWNVAGDFIINDMLVNDKIGTMPQGCLLNPALVQAGDGTTEGVYNLLPDQDDGKGGGSGYDQWDNCEDVGGSAAEQSATEAQLKVMVAQAAQAARMQGKLSANLQRFVDMALKPKVDWKDVLRRFVSARAKVDRTFAKPKRRFIADDIYLPSLSGEQMGVIAIAVDCSGSIGDEELAEFAAEIQAIKEDCLPLRMEVVYFDSEVCHHDTFEQDDELHVEPHGGGGTAFSPIFRHLDRTQAEPVCCVVLTDLYCSDFGDAPAYPVLWITTAATEAPWGQIVEMHDKRA